MSEQRKIPLASAVRAVTALADILRELGGTYLCVDIKHDGTARISVQHGTKVVAMAVLATKETGSAEWEVVSGGDS